MTDDGRTTISDAIAAIGDELSIAAKRQPLFHVEGVEVELGLVLEAGTTESAGLKWVVEAGAKQMEKSTTSHVVRIQLKPYLNKHGSSLITPVGDP